MTPPKNDSNQGEAKLEQLAKKLLNTKPKPRQDLVGKGKKKSTGKKKPKGE